MQKKRIRAKPNEALAKAIEIKNMQNEKAPEQNQETNTQVDLHSAKQKLKSGFFWLGTARIVSQALDSISLIIVMIYLDKADMGLATLAVGFAQCISAFNSLGVGKALVQDKNLTENETHSLFWLAAAVGAVMALLLTPVAWGASLFYENDALFWLILVAVSKCVTGSIADIPKKLLERRLEYTKTMLVHVLSTLVHGVSKILLAVLGAGAWALVGGFVLHGLAYFCVALILACYRPKCHFKWHECQRFLHFGIRYCASTLVENLNKNTHYFIVGKFFGEAALGVYRVGYELAMTPAMALLDVVNESSYAVFAKVKQKKDELSALFAWNQGNIAIFSAVPILFILFCAADIFSLINDGEWIDATAFIPMALGVAFVKALLQTFPELYRACGKPGFALRTDLAECLLIAVGFTIACLTARALGLTPLAGINTVLAVWIALFIPLFVYHIRLSKTLIHTGIRATFKSIAKALLFMAAAATISVPLWAAQSHLPFQPWGHITLQILILLACIGVYARGIRSKNG